MSRYHSCGRHPRVLPTDRSPFGQTVAPQSSIQSPLHTAGVVTCVGSMDPSTTTTNTTVDLARPVINPTPFANEAVHGDQLRPLTTQPTRSQRTLEWTQAGTVRLGFASVVLLFLIATIAGATTTTGWLLAIVAVLATHHRRAHSFTAQPAPGRQTLEWTQAGTVRRVLVSVALLFHWTGKKAWNTTSNPGHTMDRPALSGADLLLAPSSV